ncbi:hypothetical protein BDB01DRAFT_799971 [Pilobolus umbonatus]|nr:hypothetical protein BDB01DRAFT_799971 [Pilobolus umbonatus]
MDKGNHASLYDNIPRLDSWYKQEVVLKSTTNVLAKRRKMNGVNVSFSTVPPAIHQYQTMSYKQEKPLLHRRNSSVDSVKDFIKHYTSKISRHLH